MARTETDRLRRRGRLLAGWLFTALIAVVYFLLPGGGEEPVSLEPTPAETADAASGPRQLEILEVTPARPSSGRAITITYTGANDEAKVHAFAGKVDMEVVAHGHGALVARVPSNLPPGRIKLRLVDGADRSKPYALTLRAPNFQKPFRNLLGGFALLIFGIGVLARGAREAAGFASAHTFALLSRRALSTLGLGGVLGALAQSTTASAGVLAGLVASNLLAVGPAAVAFLGAQFGATAAPLATGLIDSRDGLVIVALGVFWLNVAQSRRSSAFARLLLGAGLMAFGLQTFRPGFELLVQDPTLLSFLAKLKAHGFANIAVCAGLGALLVAVLQGPAPVAVLVLLVAQTTAEWDLTTALSMLAGTGLGASVGALITAPTSRRGREFAKLNLLLGGASTVLAALSVGLWSHLADLIVPGVPHVVDWARRAPLPNLASHLGVAFTLSQIGVACALLPAVGPLARWLERRSADAAEPPLARVGDPVGVARAELLDVLRQQDKSLPPLRELVQNGSRVAGRRAENCLSEAHSGLETLLAGPVLALPDTPEGRLIGRAAFTSMQLQRSFEGLHRQAERLVDSRIATSASGEDVLPLPRSDDATLAEMHGLLADGVRALISALDEREHIDLEAVRGREIEMNGLEASARNSLREADRPFSGMGSHLRVLELVDAYESSGNQLYRLAEALADSVESSVARRVV
jgi:hypothetical protein